MLAHLRFIATAHRELKKGNWQEDFQAPGPRELAEVQVGIIGYGLIGKRVHALLKPFGSKIAIFDPFLEQAPEGAELVSLDELVSTSDVVTVHVPLSESTRDLIGAREIAMMKPGSIIVNTARAEIVNQAALRNAIADGSLSGAALDVFDSEPIAADDVLVLASSTTITPHLAGTTRQAFVQGPIWIGQRMQELTLEG
jgi:D-3-phosphoglycerate dehydrogenase